MHLAPSGKTNTTVFSGAIVTVAAWAVNGLTGVEVPGEVWAAITTIVMGLIAWLVPAKSGKFIEIAQDDGYLNTEDIAAEHADDADIDEERIDQEAGA